MRAWPVLAIALLVCVPALAQTDNGTVSSPPPQRGFGAFNATPIDGLALSLDPSGPFTVQAGQSFSTQLVMRNDGNASRTLNVTAIVTGFGNRTGNRTANGTFDQANGTGGGFGGFGGGRRGSGQRDVTVQLESATGTVDAGQTVSDGIQVSVAPTANASQRVLTVIVRDEAANETSIVRENVTIEAAPTAASDAGVQNAGSAAGGVKKSPGPELGLLLAVPLVAALGLARLRRR